MPTGLDVANAGTALEPRSPAGEAGSKRVLPIDFGRYQLLERIGVGGMAEVFRARLSTAAGTEKVVCIKRILPHLSQNRDFMALFISEAKIALPLAHGNITQVFDFGEVDGVYYIAMEYVHGRNLAQLIQRASEGGQPLDVEASLYIAREVCRGLQYAHSFKGKIGRAEAIVHRDVSPHNVLVSYDGEVKLTDFGIALAARQAHPEDRVLRGKPCYLSPEQAERKPSDPRSDVFSLGTVLYEMLTDQRVFEGETDQETLLKVRQAVVPPPSAFNKDVDAEVDGIVQRAMARDVDQRYPRAADLLAALTDALHRRDAKFSAERMSDLCRGLFTAELRREEERNGMKDHLLLQLAQAGIEVDAEHATTRQLLELGTVAIQQAKSVKRRPWGFIAAAIAACVLSVGAVTYSLWTTSARHQGPAPRPNEALAAAQGRASEPTEHLLPPSLRSAVQAGTAEAAETASAESKTTGADGAAKAGRTSAARGVLAARNRTAFLNCNSWPWSVVYLDGHRLRGNTPLYRVPVTPGEHHVRFVNPELGMERDVPVDISSGDVKTVAVTLQE